MGVQTNSGLIINRNNVDGEEVTHFKITDIVNGLLLAAESPDSTGEAFNLGCSNPIQVIDLVNKMYEISGRPQKLKFVEKQKGDVDVTHSDITKAKQILKYSPLSLPGNHKWIEHHLLPL